MNATTQSPVCNRCGGPNICIDAAARWDEDAGNWVVSSYFDDGHCDDCEDECQVDWVSVKANTASLPSTQPPTPAET